MVFEYKQDLVFTKQIDIVELGDTAIKCTDQEGNDYYLLMKTYGGKTVLLRYGPVDPDENEPIEGFSLSLRRVDFNERRLYKEIDSLLNDPKKLIESAEEMSVDEALYYFPKIIETFKWMGGNEE